MKVFNGIIEKNCRKNGIYLQSKKHGFQKMVPYPYPYTKEFTYSAPAAAPPAWGYNHIFFFRKKQKL